MTNPPNDAFEHVRRSASKQRVHLQFDARKLTRAKDQYVAFIDLMGAGHTMATSVAKSANFIARLHMAVIQSAKSAPAVVRLNPVNDGVFVTSESKSAIMHVVRKALYLLSSYFISTGPPQDKFLVRSSIAYGPVYHGNDLAKGLSITKAANLGPFMSSVQFGSPIIQAYRQEGLAVPFGCAIHESARAFAPANFEPFRQNHWLWWQTQKELPMPTGICSLRDLTLCLRDDLERHFDWMAANGVYNEVPKTKLDEWKARVTQYFSVG